MSNSTERSSILLLCLGVERRGEESKYPSVQDLRRIFGSFGPLLKVVIFSRKSILKAFVEFQNSFFASRARAALNGKGIEPYGVAKIYFSGLQELAANCPSLESWDAFSPEPVPFFGRMPDDFGRPSESWTPFSLSQDSPLSRDGKVSPATCADMSELESRGSRLPSLSQFLEKMAAPAERPRETSGVVLVSNLDEEFVSTSELFNLFSCFGYVTKILLMKNLRKALVEFSHAEHAKSAVQEVNQACFARFRLKANFSKYQRIDLKRNNKSQNSQQFNEVLTPCFGQNRFAHNDFSSRQHLSRSLMVCFEHPSQSAQHLDIFLAVQELASPVHVKIIRDCPSGFDSFSLKFDFADLEESLVVLMKLHRKLINSAPLSVSFA